MGFFKVANFTKFLLASIITVWLITDLYDNIRFDIIMYGDIQFDFSLVYCLVLVGLGIHFTMKFYKRLTNSDKDYEKLYLDVHDKYLKRT